MFKRAYIPEMESVMPDLEIEVSLIYKARPRIPCPLYLKHPCDLVPHSRRRRCSLSLRESVGPSSGCLFTSRLASETVI